ncbi:hypothetical protein [Metabacillus indicus]|uniref:Uncharacterized protein n=1 Tax=Metabacillus indicus TaxID=246786 RepID=A0A084GXF8_METID|nr:hypothetical protein [Metabacillus indicus]KEZ52020.1 hypothetical protein GS18_0213070 [Metabacillus indicus]
MLFAVIIVSGIYAAIAAIYCASFFTAVLEKKRYKLQHLLHLMLWFSAAFVLGISYAGTSIYWMIYLVISIFLASVLYALSYVRGKETVSLTVMDTLKMKSPQADV